MEKSVYFRALEPEDAELIYQWHNDAEMMKNAKEITLIFGLLFVSMMNLKR